MKRPVYKYIIGLTLAGLVLLTILNPRIMISPGDPIEKHSHLATDCFACHTPFLGSTPEKCIECHKVADIGIKTTQGKPIKNEGLHTGFHQGLLENDCVACHSDHNGVLPFRTIGQFSHEILESDIRHNCAGCHSNPDDLLHKKMKYNCSGCHSSETWKPATFDHSEFFRFDKHHKPDCKSCHEDYDYKTYTCYSCHEHSPGKIRQEHLEEGITNYEPCTECHNSGDEDEAESKWRKHKSYSDSHERDDDDD